LSPEVEAKLKILGFTPFDLEARFVGEKKIIKPIGCGIVEKRWNPERVTSQGMEAK
jgi:hypothetical protein